MLQVTGAAASILKREVLHEGNSVGKQQSARAIRLQTTLTREGTQALAEPLSGPQPGDAAAETTDLDVFIASRLVAVLDSAVLDGRETPDGPEVFLREQSEGAEGPGP